MTFKKYEIEREGQIDFFKNYGIPYEEDESILADNTDGVYNGVLLEFKLNINNLNTVLFQAIKYLSRMRIKGESVPAKILLISLNNRVAYEYDSKDYLKEIEREYAGAASRDNAGFIGEKPKRIYQYSEMVDSSDLKKLLKNDKKIEEMYIPINIDESCIVGWAERYYRENPKANKGNFIGDDEGVVKITGEIREPVHFKGLINPYSEKTNMRFKYLMDRLNDRLQKKDLGAFYTPMAYCKKAAELVQLAVNKAIDGGKKDYIVLDRCAGTGNLESALIGLYDKNGDEIINHAVISTYEYYEYKVLNERLGDKVREIIPPTEADVSYSGGVVANADAMSEEYINNPILRQYIEDKNCAIIIFENPPYRDEASGVINGEVERSGKRKTFISKEMKKEVKGVATNELANQFIWSAFKYYLRDEADSYIVFSPIKYWKQYNFIKKKPIKAFSFNRAYFHATSSAILCVLWENKNEKTKIIKAEAYDIEKENEMVFVKEIIIKKVFKPASRRYSKPKCTEHDLCNIWCNKDGSEALAKKKTVKSYSNNNIIGYLEADSFQVAPQVRNIVRHTLYNGHGCYLSRDNYVNILPIWVAKHIPLDNWYEKDIYATTSDGGDAYTKDSDFLKSCLIYTCLSNQNKCLSFTGSDGRYYKNELCFEEGSLARKDLEKYTLDETEKELLSLWEQILEKAKETKNYNKDLTYGVYQIIKELNTFEKIKIGKTTKNSYDYPELNGDLESLRVKLKEYYKSHIWDKMFQYELVK